MPQNQNVLGLYEVENINDPCLITLAVTPKEYIEYFKSENLKKKTKTQRHQKGIGRYGLRKLCRKN